MSTYLIAGGAGFIGSNLCKRLLEEGNRVICVDNLLTGSEENISELLKNENFTHLNHDVIHSLPEFDEKIDVIYHLASPASPNMKSSRSYIAHPVETLLVNSIGTKNLLDLALSQNATFIYASSSEVYGDPDVSPQSEEYHGNVSPNGIRSVYDEGKRFGEAMTFAYIRKHDVKAVVIRIFNTYGPRMHEDDGRVVSNFITQSIKNEDITVYGDGSQTRSFCYIEDLIEGLVAAAKSDDARGMVINLGNPEEYTINELASKIKELTGSESNIIHEDLPQDDPRKRKPDITVAGNVLSFNPKVSVNEGLKKTIEYFKSRMQS